MMRGRTSLSSVACGLVAVIAAVTFASATPAQVARSLPGQLQRTIPAQGARDVSLNQAINLFFSVPIDQTTIHAGAFGLYEGQALLPTSRTLSVDNRVVSLRCPVPLPGNRQIRVAIDGSLLLDTAGNPIDANGSGQGGGRWNLTFTTGMPTPQLFDENLGTITGYVFDMQDPPQPVANAVILGYPFPRSEGQAPLNAPAAISDGNGFFRYSPPPTAGEQTVLVEIRKAGFSESLREIELLPGACWRAADSFLQPLTPRVMVPMVTGGTLVDPANPEVRLIIPPMALQADSSIGVTLLTSSTTLRKRLPQLVAEGDFVDITGVFGEQTTMPVTLEVPNTYNLPVGTQIPFGKVDHNTLQWSDLRNIGNATVGTVMRRPNNSTYIEVQFDQFCSICTGYCLPFPDPNCADGSCGNGNGNPDCDGPGSQSGNSVVSLREGHLQESFQLPALFEMGNAFQLTFGYASNTAAPSITLAANVDYASTRPVEATIYRFQIEGQVAEGVYARSSNNEKPASRFFWDGRDGLGSMMTTGSYSYELEATSLNANTRVAIPAQFGQASTRVFSATYPGLTRLRSQVVRGRTILVNQQRSPFGAGWTLMMEPRLHFDRDGCIVLTKSNSDYRRFEPDPQTPNLWVAPEGESSALAFDAQNKVFLRVLPSGTTQTFARNGRITRAEDRFGHRITYTYSGPLLTRITSPTGYFFAFSYDGSGKLTQVRDSANRITQFVVDSAGDLIEWTDPAGVRRQFQYDSEHRLVGQVGPRGERSEYDYINGRVVAARVYDVDGTTLLRDRRFVPSALNGEITAAQRQGLGTVGNPIPLANGRVDLQVDGLGNVRETETNSRGQTIRSVDELGRETRFVFNSKRQLLTEIYPDGSRSENTYDNDGNLTQIVEKSNATSVYSTTTIAYQGPFGELTEIVDPEGKRSRLEYDAIGNISAEVTHDNERTLFFYEDPRFPQIMTRIVDPTGNVLRMTYNAHGNRATATDFPDPVGNPGGRTSTYSYNAAGMQIRVTDPRGLASSFTMDASGKIRSMTDELLQVVRFLYTDPATGAQTDNLTRVVLPNGRSIRYVHDGLNRVVSRIDARNMVSTVTYDNESRPLSITNRNGETVTYEHDAAGQMIRKFVPGVGATTYDYDVNGEMTVAADSQCRLLFEPDFLGRTIRSTAFYDVAIGSNRATLQHQLDLTHDRTGQRLSVTDNIGLTNQTYSYDNQHRLQSVTLPDRGNQSWTFGYDTVSRNTQVTAAPNGVNKSYSYDRSGSLSSISHGSSPSLTESYPNIDPIGNVLGTRRMVGTSSLVGTFGMDAASQLTSAVFSAALGNSQVNRSYSYDPANRLLADEDFTYRYDNEGQLIERTRVGTSLTETFDWNADGQLRSVTQTQDQNGTPVVLMQASYVYDPFGRRVVRDVNGVMRQYVWDGTRLLYTLDGSGRVERAYTHAMDMEHPLAVLNPITDETYYYLRGGLGSIVGLADSAGNLTDEYRYEEFGNVVSSSSPLAKQAFGFTGREFDPEIGLQRHLMRMYDPSTGRFTTEDPLGWTADPNFYRYVRGNPLRGTDPFGLDWVDWFINPTTANFAAGAGDILSFGLTDVVRDQIGANDVINKKSGAYKWGMATGVGIDLAIGGSRAFSTGFRGTRNAVFYSGRGGREAAERFARGTGGKLLKDTPGGALLNRINDIPGVKVPEFIWQGASGLFAANTRGPVSAFVRNADPGRIWAKIEKPILELFGRRIYNRMPIR